MKNEQQIMADLEKVGFPKKDKASVLKIQKMQSQLVEMGMEEEAAYKTLLQSVSSKRQDSARGQKIIDIFRQSSLNSDEQNSYFDIKGKVEYLEKSLKHYGFRRDDFLLAVQKTPILLNVSPEKFESHVIRMDEKYAKDGLGGQRFLQMALKHPDLVQYDFETLDGKIQTLMDDFSRYGIKTSDLMTAFSKQPDLLTVKPEKVIYNAHLLMHHHKQGLWQVGNGEPENQENALRAILTTRPMGLNFGVPNLRMRRIYAILKPDETLALGTYLRTKTKLQPILESGLIARGKTSLLERLYKRKCLTREK